MKQVAIIISFVVIILGYFNHYEANAGLSARDSMDTIQTIEHLLADHGYEMTRWHIEIKGEHNVPSRTFAFKQELEQLKAQMPTFTWRDIVKTGDSWKAVAQRRKQSIQETIVFLYHEQQATPQVRLIYEVTGEPTDVQTLSHRLSEATQLFNDQPKLYYNVTGHCIAPCSAPIREQALALEQAFHATPVEAIEEETFVSRSAYTNMWQQSIQVNDQPMNLQIALRDHGLGEQDTVIIGTPILLTEY